MTGIKCLPCLLPRRRLLCHSHFGSWINEKGTAFVGETCLRSCTLIDSNPGVLELGVTSESLFLTSGVECEWGSGRESSEECPFSCLPILVPCRLERRTPRTQIIIEWKAKGLMSIEPHITLRKGAMFVHLSLGKLPLDCSRVTILVPLGFVRKESALHYCLSLNTPAWSGHAELGLSA